MVEAKNSQSERLVGHVYQELVYGLSLLEVSVEHQKVRVLQQMPRSCEMTYSFYLVFQQY